MSWDIVVQDVPATARHVRDIPDDFSPNPIGARDWIVRTIRDVARDADFSDPTWGIIERPGYSIEISIGAAYRGQVSDGD